MQRLGRLRNAVLQKPHERQRLIELADSVETPEIRRWETAVNEHYRQLNCRLERGCRCPVERAGPEFRRKICLRAMIGSYRYILNQESRFSYSAAKAELPDPSPPRAEESFS
jgi:hypothetical protein